LPLASRRLLRGRRLANRAGSAEIRDEEERAEGKVGGAEDQVGWVHAFLQNQDDDRNGVDEFFEDGGIIMGRKRIGSLAMKMKVICQTKAMPANP
jgi:hypothetical protein